jgi:hypothetical protein
MLGAVWRWHLGLDSKLQFVACKDIGIFDTMEFTHPEAAFYHKCSIGLAGDYLSISDADRSIQNILL